VLADRTWARRGCSAGSWPGEDFAGKSIVLAVADVVAVAGIPVELDFVNRSVEVAA